MMMKSPTSPRPRQQRIPAGTGRAGSCVAQRRTLPLLGAALFSILGSFHLYADSPHLGAVTLSSPQQHVEPGEGVRLEVAAELDGVFHQLVVYRPSGHRVRLEVRAEGPNERELSDATVRFVSLNPAVATLDSRGLVRVRDFGVATLRAEVTLGEESRTAQVTLGAPQQLLEEADFIFDGPYGSLGSSVAKVGENHFEYVRGEHPENPSRRSSPQFIIPAGLRGNALTLDIRPFSLPSRGHYNNLAYSFDGRNWTPILQKRIEDNVVRIELPPGESDRLYFGVQIPFSYEAAVERMRDWAEDPATSGYVTLHEVGESLEGRKLLRMEVTDPESPHPREERWVHYISQAHPHEGKSRWRVVGMIEWLLSDEGADARRRHIWHFVPTMNPDGVNNGFTRVNMEDIDMNRTFRVGGPDRSAQAHEGYLFQKDIQALVESDTPLTTFWDMHVWWGPVEPMMHPGPEFGSGSGKLGEWTELRDIMVEKDPEGLIKPLATRSAGGGTTVWDRGVHREFGITAALVEGGGELDTPEENMEAGAIMMRSLNEFYRGTRSEF